MLLNTEKSGEQDKWLVNMALDHKYVKLTLPSSRLTHDVELSFSTVKNLTPVRTRPIPFLYLNLVRINKAYTRQNKSLVFDIRSHIIYAFVFLCDVPTSTIDLLL